MTDKQFSFCIDFMVSIRCDLDAFTDCALKAYTDGDLKSYDSSLSRIKDLRLQLSTAEDFFKGLLSVK